MIRIEGLTKYYKDLCAVDRLDLEVSRGEIVGLLGPNGAGKTTTLRMLTCFLKPSSGTIRIQDYNADDNVLAIKRLMGYLPESAPLYHDMLVYDYLVYIAAIRGIAEGDRLARIKSLVDLCGLKGVMHKSIGELSKGYKQRVGLAHAMMSGPDILVLDEPTSGLDPNQIVEIREIIRRIGREKTIILSTHILSEAEATCDRVVIIHRGRIVADGSTDTLKQTAGMEKVLKVSLNAVDAAAVKNSLEGVAGVRRVEHPATEGEAIDLTLFCDPDQDVRRAVYRLIKETDWDLLSFYPETQSLEKIFRQLTQEN